MTPEGIIAAKWPTPPAVYASLGIPAGYHAGNAGGDRLADLAVSKTQLTPAERPATLTLPGVRVIWYTALAP